MISKTLTAVAAVALMGTPALAAHCPKDAAAIEHALTKTSLSAADKAEVERLKNEGVAQHEAGNHRESEALLADAMRRLLLAE
ncbi:hypothetical protein ABUE31_08015 [Mesorhizobium sp. ZMM04-5]|uniref:Uncharacterized protein n=1 Tax=Mesorhizobium marinum TaxID=3228790 RepID=A0ABV3QZI5_9HYPH